jgi:hypothetical protein
MRCDWLNEPSFIGLGGQRCSPVLRLVGQVAGVGICRIFEEKKCKGGPGAVSYVMSETVDLGRCSL